MTDRTEFTIETRDCIEGMAAMPETSVDIVVTSPPYNLGIKYSRYDDRRASADYFDWTRKWAAQVKRVLKPKGSFFLNVGASPANPMMPHEIILALKYQFVLQNTFHWIKSITVQTKEGEQISAGHFKPIQSQRFVNDCHEFVFH